MKARILSVILIRLSNIPVHCFSDMSYEDEDMLIIKDDSDSHSFLGIEPGIVYPYSDKSFEEFLSGH